MPMFLYSVLFEYLSGAEGAAVRRKGGWSESVYASDVLQATRDSFDNLMTARSRLLPADVAVIGGRIQQVDPVGSAQSFVRQLPGTAGDTNRPDIPQMALLVRARAVGVGNVRSMRLAAIPDFQVVNGEYSPSTTYRTRMGNYLTQLGFWKMRGQDLTLARKRVLTISAGGVYALDEDLLLTVEDKVRLYNARDTAGRLVQGVFTVSAVASSRAGTLASWTAGATTGGLFRKVVYIYPQILVASTDISRIVTRKIGRPFTGYVGRQRRTRR